MGLTDASDELYRSWSRGISFVVTGYTARGHGKTGVNLVTLS